VTGRARAARALRRAAAAAAVSLPTATGAQAQDNLRSLEISRQLHDSSALEVRVQYGLGRLDLRAAESPVLYQMNLRYDAERAEPLHDFSQSARSLRIGLRKQSMSVPGENKANHMRLELSRGVPLDLSLDFGAVEANLDLSGLTIERMKVQSGASDATIRFDTPNPGRMRSLELNGGAAHLNVLGLANANVEDVTVQAGVGSVELDFSGDWVGERDISLNVQIALGGVKVRVPRDVGVRVEASKFLASLDLNGLEKRGDAWFSPNYSSATHRLRIRTQTTLGNFELIRRE
jgi:hypothetical protein